jgi:hypothetical protein
VKLSAAIMAHPDRAEQVTELTAALDRPVPVHWDQEGPPSGNADRIWRSAREVWLRAYDSPAADYHVLIQDDALVCADYLAGLEQALAYVPEGAIVSPYLGTGRMAPVRWDHLTKRADVAGANWVRAERVLWGVSLVMPSADIPEMIAWCDKRYGVPDDMRVGAWAKRANREVWYTWPSLVDHRTTPSLTKHKAADRVARRHHTGSALDLRWDGPIVTDPMLLRRTGSRSGPSRLRSAREAPRAGKAGTSE